MPTKPIGNVRKHSEGYSARVRIGPYERPSFTLFAHGDEAAGERAALLADLAKRMRPVASAAEIQIILDAAGKARNPRDLNEATKAAECIIRGEALTATSAMAPTLEAFAKDWTSGELRKKHPDHVREKKDPSEDIQILRDRINPLIGMLHLPEVTLEHAERVMRALPSSLAPRTRRHTAQCLRKVLSLAVYPGRHIPSNPIPREWMPTIPKSANKAKACLWPEEDTKLARCAEVDLARRVAYGVLTREGMRASELALLKWRDIDLQHGRIRLDENKTDDPRAWALSPDVTRTLAWWKKRTGAEDADFILRLDLSQGPRWLRGKTWDPKTRHKNEIGDLRTAGITRSELFERTACRQPIRLHDLRATFVTVSLANGKTEQWVMDRTGHKSSQMIALYARQARTWAELNLGRLLPLDTLLPEMGRGASQPGPSTRPASHRPAPRRGRRIERATSGPPNAPAAGLEPATRRLTAACSTN
jgi:integrase